jgi:hypothetical protein
MLKSLLRGRLAQLVEHCDHTAGVTGSSPVAPTNLPRKHPGILSRLPYHKDILYICINVSNSVGVQDSAFNSEL